MSINQYQYEQLTEMEISLWQARIPLNLNKKKQHDYLSVNLSDLSSNQLFNDVLQSIGISLGEITPQKKHLNLGLFNWYFCVTNQGDLFDINYLNNRLITPDLTSISHSTKLKRQLWKTITNNLL